MDAKFNFQPKLCDVTNFQDIDVIPSTDNRRNAFRGDDLDLNDSSKGSKNDVTHSASKRIRIENPSQPKLEFFWKEGSQLKSSDSRQSKSTKFDESHCHRFDSRNFEPDDQSSDLKPSDSRNLEPHLQTPDMDSRNVEPNPQRTDSRNFEPDLQSPDTETPKSWSRGNFVTDTQGEVIAPVTLGRPFTTFHQPAMSAGNGDVKDDDADFDEEDFVLVKRGANQVPLSPPQRSFKKLRTDSSNVSIKNFFTAESKEKDESSASLKQSNETLKDRSLSPNTSIETVKDRPKAKASSPLKSSKAAKDRFKERIPKPQLNREYREIKFDINRLTTQSNDVETSSVAKTRVLGQLSSSGLWLFMNGESETIELLNHHRVLVHITYEALTTTVYSKTYVLVNSKVFLKT